MPSVQPLCTNRVPRPSAVQAKISTQQSRKRKRTEGAPVKETVVSDGIDETGDKESGDIYEIIEEDMRVMKMGNQIKAKLKVHFEIVL